MLLTTLTVPIDAADSWLHAIGTPMPTPLVGGGELQAECSGAVSPQTMEALADTSKNRSEDRQTLYLCGGLR
jgi:hypothetical protein